MSTSPGGDDAADVEELIDRVRRGDATADEQRDLAAWRRASGVNEQAYRQTTRLLSVSESLVADSIVPTAGVLLARPRHPPGGRWRRSILRAVPWTIAAAAVVAMFFNRTSQAASSDARWGLADVVTGTSEMTTLQLRDGSVVRLAPSSRLRFTANDSIREVELEGRAFFAVAKMPDRPFVVRTSAGNARVLGTRFEIIAQQGDLRLLVVEGRVALSAGNHRVEVAAGEVSGVRDSSTLPPTRVAGGRRMDEWVGKFLVFQATPMRDATGQIEQMYGVRIKTDSTIAGRTVTATFTDQTAEQVLDVVCSVMHAQCVQSNGVLVMTQKH